MKTKNKRLNLIHLILFLILSSGLELKANVQCSSYFDEHYAQHVEKPIFDSAIQTETVVDIKPDVEILDQEIPSHLRELKKQTTWSKSTYPMKVVWNWIHSTTHNFRGVFAVIDIMALRKMKDKLVPEDHPWVTGINPSTGKKIWPENLVFASPRNEKTKNEISDDQIVSKIGNFLASMTKRSTPETEIPQGPKRRMPHAVNYIHGTVHYNGAYMLFNNFKDAMFYFTDPLFVREFKRLSKEEKREITIIFRERDYEEYEYAFFMGFVRSTIPWYANGNGPKKKVFYGAMASYPTVNTINGSWITDMYKLKNDGPDNLARPPIEKNKYFQMSYQGDRQRYTIYEKALAYLNYLIVKARGKQGGMVFTKREVIEADKVEEYKQTGKIDAGVDWKIPDFFEELRKSLSEKEQR